MVRVRYKIIDLGSTHVPGLSFPIAGVIFFGWKMNFHHSDGLVRHAFPPLL